jgi:hypothetical protein
MNIYRHYVLMVLSSLLFSPPRTHQPSFQDYITPVLAKMGFITRLYMIRGIGYVLFGS